MFILKTLQDYREGMAAYNACHQCNFTSQWQAFQDEFSEFKAEPSWDEFWDVCHSFGKVVYDDIIKIDSILYCLQEVLSKMNCDRRN